jgi:mRNA degradation ribonuclease J1/J2
MYKQNSLSEVAVTESAPFFGLREIRVNAASYERQEEIFYNDFGNEMTAVM